MNRYPAKRSGRISTASTAPFRNSIFRHEGEYWTIVYEETLFRIRDSKGLRYLAYLLSHPDKRIHCTDLCSAVGGHAAAGPSTERNRVAVTKRIKASVAKIATLHPGLAHHLSATIKTGHFCVYVCNPGGSISWTL